MPPRLTLIANASTPAARAAAFPMDEGLDDYGRRDAAALSAEFRNAPVVIASPAKRALETAAALGLNPEIDTALRDLDLGRWAGKTLADIAQSDEDGLASWLSDPAFELHEGESVIGLFDRISVWLNAIFAREGRIVAITHPAILRVAILAAIKASPASYWHIDIAPLSIVELSSNGRRWALKSIKN